jgi:hypothetical protein
VDLLETLISTLVKVWFGFRFRVMDPNRPTFESVVDKVTLNSKMGAAGAKSFKSIAKSVLREGNSETAEMNKR